MATRQILELVLAVSLLSFFLCAYGLFTVARRRFERRNEFGVELFRSAKHAFWALSIEDIVRRSSIAALPIAAIGAAASTVLLLITNHPS